MMRPRLRFRKLSELGVDVTIQLDQPEDVLKSAFAREAADAGFDLIIDYLWGRSMETLLAAITKPEFAAGKKETRLVQAGESAGPTISLPAAVLRSTPLTIVGTAGIPSREILMDASDYVARSPRRTPHRDRKRAPRGYRKCLATCGTIRPQNRRYSLTLKKKLFKLYRYCDTRSAIQSPTSAVFFVPPSSGVK